MDEKKAAGRAFADQNSGCADRNCVRRFGVRCFIVAMRNNSSICAEARVNSAHGLE
jgi:hypothetical protein